MSVGRMRECMLSVGRMRECMLSECGQDEGVYAE